MNELSLFNSLFDNAFDCGMPDLTWKTARLPKVDVKENKDCYSLQMYLPGATEKVGLSITFVLISLAY